jgi:AAA15 family ATPase/GTPase
LELFQNKILSEELKVKSKSKKNFTEKTLYTKRWVSEDSPYLIKATPFKLPKGLDKDLLQRNNATLVGMAKHFGHDLSEKIVSFWENIFSNVTESGRSQDTISPHTIFFDESFKTFDFYFNNPGLKQAAETILARFNLGFESLVLEKKQTENATHLNVGIVQSLDRQSTAFSLSHTSEGTKQLLFLLRPILKALSRGGTVVLDEFDSSLHPDISLALFHLFVSPETNPKNAQLFFGTHNHRILADLDKYQIFITEKDSNGHASLFRLDELNVRPDENYYAKYIAGAYGGVPNIP